MIKVVISNTSGIPIYQQLFDQIGAQIVKGELPRDFALPPIRTVAKELRVSIITVKKAWEELDRRGLIYSVVGRGCFVADLPKHEFVGKRDDLVARRMAKDVAYYQDMGLSLDEIIEAVTVIYQEREQGIDNKSSPISTEESR